MTNNIFDLKRNFHVNNGIKKEDYLKLRPTTSSADNKIQSWVILFQIAQASYCLDICDSHIYFYIEINDLTADEEITLKHNFFHTSFSQMSLNIGGTDVKVIINPGEVSSLLNFILLDENTKHIYGEFSVWIPNTGKGYSDPKENKSFKTRLAIYNDKKCFEGFFPLKQLFGFLYSYKRITYLLSIDLVLNRNANNDKSIFFGKEKIVAGVTTPSKSKLVLKDIVLRVPEIRLNPLFEVNVMEQMKSLDKIDELFLKDLLLFLIFLLGLTLLWHQVIYLLDQDF